MSKVLELKEKRAKAWEVAKVFLDSKQGSNGLMSAEDAATYDRMDAEVVDLGREIDRLERQAVIDVELAKATSIPITNKLNAQISCEIKTGRATEEYRRTFWDNMRNKNSYEIQNALSIGTDSEGGFLCPDEYERQLAEVLEDEVFFRSIATVI
jgi:hypothetical protein